MNKIKALLAKVVGFFKSGSAEKAFDQVANLVPMAVSVVQFIAAATPSRTDDEIAAVFASYAVPYTADLKATPASQRGYVLLHLATEVLARGLPGVATNILNSAVQLAVTGIKAG